MIKIRKEFLERWGVLSYRLSPKDKMSRDLANLFKEMLRKTEQNIDTLAVHVGVSVVQLEQIEGGKAYLLSRVTLLRVFEFLPIDDSEARRDTSRLINVISVTAAEKRKVHFYSQR